MTALKFIVNGVDITSKIDSHNKYLNTLKVELSKILSLKSEFEILAGEFCVKISGKTINYTFISSNLVESDFEILSTLEDLIDEKIIEINLAHIEDRL